MPRKLYLGLKQSLIEFFQEPIRFIKEGITKESIYEKPYQGLDYRKMHLKASIPSWPTMKDSGYKGTEGGFSTSKLKHTYIFKPPECALFPTECIEHDDIGRFEGYIIPSFAPVESGSEYTWEVTSDTDAVTIEQVESIQGGAFVAFTIDPVNEDFEGTVTLCAKATLNGAIVSKIVFEKEAGDIVQQRIGSSSAAGFSVLGDPISGGEAKEISREYLEDNTFDCGCISFDVPCEPTECEDEEVENYEFDFATSAVSVSRNSNITIAVIDGNPPYLWTVEGQGFWFDSGYTLKNIETETKSTTLYADSTACGSGNVTVTECYERSVYASIQCPDGGDWFACKYPVQCDIDNQDVSGCIYRNNPPAQAAFFYLGGVGVWTLGDGGLQPYYCCFDGRSCNCAQGAVTIPTTSSCMNINFFACGRVWQFYLAGPDKYPESLCGTSLPDVTLSNFYGIGGNTSHFSFVYWDCD